MDKGLLQRRIIAGLVVILFAVVIGMVVIGCVSASVESDDSEDIVCDYTGSWNMIQGQYVSSVELPGHIEGIKAGEPLVLETTLPESVNDNDYFVVYADHQDARVSVSDYFRTIYSSKSYNLSGNNSPAKYVFTPLNSGDRGQVIGLTVTAFSDAFSGNVSELYLGNKHDIWMHIIRSNWLDIASAVVVLLLGLVIFFMSILISKYFTNSSGTIYLALNVLVLGIGLMFNLRIRQLLFPIFSILDITSIFLWIISDFALNIYVAFVITEKRRMIHGALGAILFADFFVIFFLHATKIVDVYISKNANLVICALIRLVLVAVIIMQLLSEKKIEKIYPGIGVCCYAVLSIIGQYLAAFDYYIAGHAVLTLGIIGNTIGLIMMIMNVHIKSETEKESAIVEAQARTMFLATMSHDIRTPINTVLGMNEMILRENTNPQITEYSRDIQRAGKMLLNLVNDILDFSKIDSGKLELVIDEYKVGLVITDLLNLIEERAKDKNLKVICDVEPNIPSELRGDEMRIKQIVMNLLTNAVKYTEKGSVTMKVSGEYDENGKFVIRFDVIDTGQGIKKENIDKLFMNYTRLEEKANKGIEGTGLGLGITKNLLDIMGGRISVASEFGVGSTFTVFIPQEVVSGTPIGDFKSSLFVDVKTSEHKKFTAPMAQILVVDDNRMNLNVIKGLLKETKIQLHLARSGQECLDLCYRIQYDLILMDHMMPEMDGIETLAKLSEAWGASDNGGMVCKKVPVIILTANAISGMKEMYISQGFTDYLSKPVDPDRLESMICNYLPAEKIEE